MDAAAACQALELGARSRGAATLQLLGRAVLAGWKFLVGVLACTHPLTALVVVGWTSRLMQRVAVRHWWRHTRHPYRKVLAFRDFAASRAQWEEFASWPHWVLPPQPVRHLRSGRVHRLPGGLLRNAVLGLQLVSTTFSVLLLPGLLWSFAWYAGWQVSFHKAYESSETGRTVGLAGIVLFAVAMFHVPLAQAAQAVTGRWQAFFDFRRVRRVVRRRWFSCALLALAHVAAGFIVLAFLIGPVSPQLQDHLATLPEEGARQVGRLWYLGMAAVVFPLQAALHCWAARIHASAFLQMVRSGEMAPGDLCGREKTILQDLLGEQASAPAWSSRRRVASWSLSAPLRLGAGTLAALAWMAVAAQVFVAQFFVYHGPQLWLNHPLLQLPWTDYLPNRAAGDQPPDGSIPPPPS